MVPTEPTSDGSSTAHFIGGLLEVLFDFVLHIERILSLVLLLISNLTNGLRFHQFLVTKSREANKSVKTDANGAH